MKRTQGGHPKPDSKTDSGEIKPKLCVNINSENDSRETTDLREPGIRLRDGKIDRSSNSDELHAKLIREGTNYSTQQTSKEKQIQGWINGSIQSLPSAAATEVLHPDECLSLGENYNVDDLDYRESLSHRNIYIECTKPPAELMQRATEVIERPREPFKMDNAASQDLIWSIRKLQSANEDAIKEELAPKIIPARSRGLDERLERGSNQLWHRAVAVPLLPEYLDASFLLLPRHKPDLIFGYHKQAFTRRQILSILELVDDESGHSFSMPDQNTRFPFLAIEFKSQSKKGTHYVATNETAGAGAIAINGQLKPMRRAYGVKAFDKSTLRFFSVTIDQAYAQINMHWVGDGPGHGEPYSFHVEGIAAHLLRTADGMEAVACAVENILDYGVDVLLPSLCEALDAYRATKPAAKKPPAVGEVGL